MMRSNRVSFALFAAFLMSAGLSVRAKAQDDGQWYINHTAMCLNSMEDSKNRADIVKSYVGPKGHGWTESSGDKDAYNAALTQYKAAKANKYPDMGARLAGYSQNKDNDACGANDGFKGYEQQLESENDAKERAYQAANNAGSLTPDQQAIKTQLDPCVAQLKTLKADNAKLNENSKNIFHTANPQLTTWGKVDATLNGFLNSYAWTYTADNLATCQKLAADTTVSDEYSKLTGMKVEQNKKDAAADAAAVQAAKDKQKADQAKAAADEAARKKAQADADAAKYAADHDPVKLQACIDGVTKRRNDATTKLYAKENLEGTFSPELKDWIQKQVTVIDSEINAMTNSKATTVSNCTAPWPELDQLEKQAGIAAAKAQDIRDKEAADAKAKQDALNAAAAKERAAWLRDHPTDIPGACKAGCKLFPDQASCERDCAIVSNDVKTVVDVAGDELLKPVDAFLDKVGASKALCEAASSKAGQALAKANNLIDKLGNKVQEKGEDTCLAKSMPKKKCTYVGKFFKTVSDVRDCTNTSKSLNKSMQKTEARYQAKKKAADDHKAKANKKEEDSPLKDAAKDTAIDSAETCESPKASDLIANLIKPCTDAAEDTAWLLEHASDYQ
jgi:hypothetical protein